MIVFYSSVIFILVLTCVYIYNCTVTYLSPLSAIMSANCAIRGIINLSDMCMEQYQSL